jgi:ribose transport system substrate-binding protein
MNMRKAGAAILAVLAVGAIGACGSDNSCSSSSSSSSDAKASGPNTTPKKVGLLEIVGAAEVTTRGATAFKTASGKLNWKPTVVDPQGDPQKANAGLSNLVTQGNDAILVAPWESTVLRQSLTKATQAKIPVGVVWGEVGAKEGYTGYYATSDTEFGQKSVDEVHTAAPAGGETAMFTSSAFYFGQTRDKVFQSTVGPKYKIVAKHDTDYTNPQADTTKALNDILNAHPNLKVIWADSSFQAPPIAAVLKKKGLCGKIVVVSFYGDLANLKGIRDGCLTSILEASIEAQTWTAMDLLAGKLYAKKDLPPTTPKTYPFDPNKITVVTKDNVPKSAKEYVAFKEDYVKYFTDKWAKGDYGAPAG